MCPAAALSVSNCSISAPSQILRVTDLPSNSTQLFEPVSGCTRRLRWIFQVPVSKSKSRRPSCSVVVGCALALAAFDFSRCALRVPDSLTLAGAFAFDFAETWLLGKRSPAPHNTQQIQTFVGVIKVASSRPIGLS